jgi:hypothetical protein
MFFPLYNRDFFPLYNITVISQPLSKCIRIRIGSGNSRCQCPRKIPYPWDFPLLRLDWKAKRQEHSSDTESNDSAPQSHLITLSALASTFGGIVRPICLAAFKLITSSNFVGCSIGRSAGLAPLRILST